MTRRASTNGTTFGDLIFQGAISYVVYLLRKLTLRRSQREKKSKTKTSKPTEQSNQINKNKNEKKVTKNETKLTFYNFVNNQILTQSNEGHQIQ